VKGITSYFHGDLQRGVLRTPGEVTVLGLVDSTRLVVSTGAAGLKAAEDFEDAVSMPAEAGSVAGVVIGAITGAVADMDVTGMSTGLGN